VYFLQEVMPHRGGGPIYFNDHRYRSVAGLGSVIAKARALVLIEAEQKLERERTAVAMRRWLLAEMKNEKRLVAYITKSSGGGEGPLMRRPRSVASVESDSAVRAPSNARSISARSAMVFFSSACTAARSLRVKLQPCSSALSSWKITIAYGRPTRYGESTIAVRVGFDCWRSRPKIAVSGGHGRGLGTPLTAA
jgi:hypothetical protein